MKRFHGFTLIELMIAVVVIGILASVAYPSYMESVRKSKRAEVKAALLEGAQALERHYSANNTYLSGSALAAVFKTTVPASGSQNYTIAVSGTPTATTYTLLATRTGSMANDPCGNFEITHTGARDVKEASGKTVADCW